ncbi:MAG: hypothetical protein P8X57_00860 [Cyclobacteriaceae bacterium]
MKSTAFYIVLMVFSITVAFRPVQDPEERKTDYIDSEGRSGVLSGKFDDQRVLMLSFTSETETGIYKEEFTYNENQIAAVSVKETMFNRPKFWNEALARANNDNEWFDPDKSKRTVRIYYYTAGTFDYWEDESGNRNYPVNKKLRKEGERFMKKANDYLAALKQ